MLEERSSIIIALPYLSSLLPDLQAAVSNKELIAAIGSLVSKPLTGYAPSVRVSGARRGRARREAGTRTAAGEEGGGDAHGGRGEGREAGPRTGDGHEQRHGGVQHRPEQPPRRQRR